MEYWSDSSLLHNIAHRGASAYAPDNSLKAFELAREHFATDIETDLHSTNDGRFVIRHDTTIGGKASKFISELSYDEYKHACDQQSEPCIELDQVIEMAKENSLGLYLEVKQVLPRMLPSLLEIIRSSNYSQKIIIASFRTDIIKEVKERAPDLLTSALFHSPNLDLSSLVKGVKCDFLHPCFDILERPLKYFTSEWVDLLKKTGAGLIAWNVTTAEMADVIVRMDINGVCADDPQIIEDALRKYQNKNSK